MSERVRVRRVPRYSVFLVLGGALGVLTAAILTYAFQGTDAVSPSTGLVYTSGQVFGFLALICVVAGVGVFGVLALVLDRVNARRAREHEATHETIHVAAEPSEAEAASRDEDDDAAGRIDR